MNPGRSAENVVVLRMARASATVASTVDSATRSIQTHVNGTPSSLDVAIPPITSTSCMTGTIGARLGWGASPLMNDRTDLDS